MEGRLVTVRPSRANRFRGIFAGGGGFVRGHPILFSADLLLERLGTVVVHGESVLLNLEQDEEAISGGLRDTDGRSAGCWNSGTLHR